jgi:two-component system, chemotaxis family, protein-glutamate methylesterase/glutaminase
MSSQLTGHSSNAAPESQWIGTCRGISTSCTPYVTAERIRKEIPDVITLDVEMPRMDGITFLGKIMSRHPVPVAMCSSLSGRGSETVFKALEYGAVEIIQKPWLGVKQFLEESRVMICDTVKAASMVRVRQIMPALRAVPLGRPLCGQKCRWCHHDRYG